MIEEIFKKIETCFHRSKIENIRISQALASAFPDNVFLRKSDFSGNHETMLELVRSYTHYDSK